MNANPTTSELKFAICALAAFIFAASAGRASIVVVSNLAPEGEEVLLKDSSGTPLPVGTEVRIGTFGNENVRRAGQTGRQVLLSIFRPFGAAMSIGDGAGGRAGMLEASASEPVDASAEIQHFELYLLVGNALTLETSTELLALKLPSDGIPTDIPGGIENYVGVPIRDGHPEFGSVGGGLLGTDFRTAPIKILPPPFDEWIAGHLSGAPPEDLLPDADPDRDRVSNIHEFALGSDPGNPASRATLRVTMVHGSPHVVFYRRRDTPQLIYTVEEGPTPAGPWHGGGNLLQVVEDPSPPPPPDYEEVRQQMHGGMSYYARLLIEYSP